MGQTIENESGVLGSQGVQRSIRRTLQQEEPNRLCELWWHLGFSLQVGARGMEKWVGQELRMENGGGGNHEFQSMVAFHGGTQNGKSIDRARDENVCRKEKDASSFRV